MHLPPLPRFLVRFVLRSVLVIVFIGLPAAILYLREVGVGPMLQDRVAEALSGEGFLTRIGKLSFDPFTGLVADNVEVVTRKSPETNLARVERLVISINLNDLLARQISIDYLQLDETDVSFPVGLTGGRVTVTGVSGQVLFDGNQLRLSYFEGTVQGIKVKLSGLLQNPQALQPRRNQPTTPSAETHAALTDWLDRFAELTFSGAPPQLEAEITGDLADLDTLEVRPIVLRSGPIRGPNWSIDGLEAAAEYRHGTLDVGKFLIRGPGGTLTASAEYREKLLTFDVLSSLSPEPFLNLLPKDAPGRQVRFTEAPQIEASGSVDFSAEAPKVSVIGSLRLGAFGFRGVKFERFAADFAARDGRVFTRGATLEADGGTLRADLLFAPGDIRLRLTNTIAPTVFLPLLNENDREFLKNMEFRDRPYAEMELRGPRLSFGDLTGAGYLKLGRTAVRGAWMDRIESRVELADSAITYRNLQIAKGRGLGTGTFVYDIGRREVRLEKIKSTLPPIDVLMWVDPKIADAVRPYRFRQPPRILADGLVHMKDVDKNALALKIESDEGVDYDLLNRTLPFGRTLADVNVKGRRVLANVKSARLMGGEASIRANVSIDEKDPTFSADLEIRRVDFARLTKLYFDYDDSQGVVSGTFGFSARMREEEKLRGKGSIRVEDGQVFAIPILGPLSDIINTIIPKAGYEAARLATADFTIADEKIRTENLEIEGAGFSLFGKGDIFFMKDRMDMSVRINARGIPGIVLFPVSKLFEYVSTGSVSNPEWKPKIIPRFGSGENKTP